MCDCTYWIVREILMLSIDGGCDQVDVITEFGYSGFVGTNPARAELFLTRVLTFDSQVDVYVVMTC